MRKFTGQKISPQADFSSNFDDPLTAVPLAPPHPKVNKPTLKVLKQRATRAVSDLSTTRDQIRIRFSSDSFEKMYDSELTGSSASISSQHRCFSEVTPSSSVSSFLNSPDRDENSFSPPKPHYAVSTPYYAPSESSMSISQYSGSQFSAPSFIDMSQQIPLPQAANASSVVATAVPTMKHNATLPPIPVQKRQTRVQSMPLSPSPQRYSHYSSGSEDADLDFSPRASAASPVSRISDIFSYYDHASSCSDSASDRSISQPNNSKSTDSFISSFVNCYMHQTHTKTSSAGSDNSFQTYATARTSSTVATAQLMSSDARILPTSSKTYGMIPVQQQQRKQQLERTERIRSANYLQQVGIHPRMLSGYH